MAAVVGPAMTYDLPDAAAKASAPLELWGGLECTVVRVGDAHRDQFHDTGHAARDGDIDMIAALGLRRLRYPVLWETVSPDHPDRCDWDWHDQRLDRLRTLGIAPIVGLVHHGSGPHYTNLVDLDLPAKLAVHARRMAERLSLGPGLDPRERGPQHGQVQWPLRELVPPRSRATGILRRARQPVPGRRSRDAGHQDRHPERPPRADRGYGQDLLDAAPRLPGRVRERASLAELRPAVRPCRRPAPAARRTSGLRRAIRRPRRARTRSVPAGHHRDQSRPHQRALPRRGQGALHRLFLGRQCIRALCRRGGRQGTPAGCRHGTGCAASRGLGALSAADRGHRGASRCDARRAVALAEADLGRGHDAALRRSRHSRRDRLVPVRRSRPEFPADGPLGLL